MRIKTVNLKAILILLFSLIENYFLKYLIFLLLPSTGAAGLVISSNRILTKALLHNQKVNTIIFFTISMSIVCLCFIMFHIVRRSDFVRYYISQCELAGLAEEQRGFANPNPASGPYTEEVSLVSRYFVCNNIQRKLNRLNIANV